MTTRMREMATTAVLLALGVSPLVAGGLVPRKSPELKFLEPLAKETLLSSFKGKVVVIEFLLINCPHCVRVAQMINKLHRDLGPSGVQAIGIAFDNGISGPAVTNFVHRIEVSYPVGYTSSDKVDSYLGRAGTERFQVPQVIVIDRQGVIRAQSRPVRELNLEDESYLRNLIQSLLKEAPPVGDTKKRASPGKKVN